MTVDSETITRLINNRSLVRIERRKIDSRTIQAFLLGFSDELLAAAYVSDFRHDGLLFLRRETITDVSVNATARFQRQLLENAGDITDSLFTLPHPIDSFATLLNGLSADLIVILEEESLEDSRFLIGRYVWRENGTHQMHEFTGAGNWSDRLTEIDLESITCCQLDTNYIRYYQRHFDTHGFPDLPN